MICVNQTRPHCVNQMGKTQTNPLAERHGNARIPGHIFVAKSIVSLLRTASISCMLMQHGDLAALTVISTDPGTEWCLELLLTGSRRLAGNND
jgi:hypothetical protein